MSKKKTLLKKGDLVEDAIYLLEVELLPRHCKNSVPADPERCALVLAAKEGHNFSDFYVYRTIAHGRYAGSNKLCRWQSSPKTLEFIERIDIEGKDKMAAVVPKEGIKFVFMPPRPAVSLTRLRSDAFKKVRNGTAKKKVKRPYRLPDPKTLAGVRSRFGYHSRDEE